MYRYGLHIYGKYKAHIKVILQQINKIPSQHRQLPHILRNSLETKLYLLNKNTFNTFEVILYKARLAFPRDTP